jgi:hypothetical protein
VCSRLERIHRTASERGPWTADRRVLAQTFMHRG